MEGMELFYCDIHQTLQSLPKCPKCKEQDGVGINGWYVEMKEATIGETKAQTYDLRMTAWRAKAKEINGKIIDKYGK